VYGSFGPLDTSRPEQLLATGLLEPHYSIDKAYVKKFGLQLAVTAIDRCGNESEPILLGDAHHPQSPSSLSAQEESEKASPYLPHDGKTLTIPYIDTAEFYLITDLPGHFITSGPFRCHVDISRLKPGIYTIRTLQKRGISRRIGDFRIENGTTKH
jgi:hypothetical protein